MYFSSSIDCLIIITKAEFKANELSVHNLSLNSEFSGFVFSRLTKPENSVSIYIGAISARYLYGLNVK